MHDTTVSFYILGDPGAVGRVDEVSVVGVYCGIETGPWAVAHAGPVPEAVGLPASDLPEGIFSGRSAGGSGRVALMFSCTVRFSSSIAIVAWLVLRGKFPGENFRTHVNKTGKITSFDTATRNKCSTMSFYG